MNVYGYNTCQYNKDDLGNQMFAHQALAFNRQNPEGHVMPVPTGTPWNVEAVSWGQSPSGLVTFTGQIPGSQEIEEFTPIIHCKRKSVDVVPAVPTKQLITEEKMAAHLNGLHISSNYTSHNSASDDFMDVNMDPQALMSEKLKGHKLVLSEEIKKLRSEPLLPPALLSRLEKPCMSLMVWKPKEDVIEKTLCKDDEKTTKESTENMNQSSRGDPMADLIGMDVEM